MEDYRSLEIKVAHARNLKNVNFLSEMDPYVVVSLSSDPQTRLRTPVARTGNKNPTWNFSLKFDIDVAASRVSRPTITFSILCERALGNKPIGHVHVPLTDLLNTVDSGKACHVAYQVRRPSGRAKGELSFSYQWGESLTRAQLLPTAPPLSTTRPLPTTPLLPMEGKAEEVVTAYPLVVGTSSSFYQAASATRYEPHGPYQTAPHGGFDYQYPQVLGYNSHPPSPYVGYPPPHQYSGYQPSPHQYNAYPPSPGPNYGYQAHPGYGYPPMQPAPKKSNKAGLGIGAGLLGGLLIGDLLF